MTCLKANYLYVADPLFGKQCCFIRHHLVPLLPWTKRPLSIATNNSTLKLIYNNDDDNKQHSV